MRNTRTVITNSLQVFQQRYLQNPAPLDPTISSTNPSYNIAIPYTQLRVAVSQAYLKEMFCMPTGACCRANMALPYTC